ncbi:leucyl aminopeptidase [Candidatus Uhrbacteria bacterium]|nr:leucyl aminopeptidase [Candidatus Uhrbacteria bacterium]
MRHIMDTQASLDAESYLIPFSQNVKLSSQFFKHFSPLDQEYVKATASVMKEDFLESAKILLPESRKKCVLICLGPKEDWTLRRARLLFRKSFNSLRECNARSVGMCLSDFVGPNIDISTVAKEAALNVEMAAYEFKEYKQKSEKEAPTIETMVYTVAPSTRARQCEKQVRMGGTIGRHVNYARTLSNIPGSDMTPSKLAASAKECGKKYGFDVQVLDEKEMRKLGMGGVLGVSRGSSEEATFIIMEYTGTSAKRAPIVFVGKGITFDSGGLNLKPSNSMDEMHMDMSGGAAVISALSAIADLKLKAHVIGLVPAVENMPSGQSYRPGDVLTSMSGKTIEIANTDAEGRVILADALTYAEQYKPTHIIDVATLTGACVIALGHHALAVLSPNDLFAKTICETGEVSGDYAWQLPLWNEYESDIRGTVGDVLNASKSREAGTINGAMFLYQFAKSFKHWAHLDIASTMTTASDQHLSKGASGTGVRLLVELAHCLSKK